MSKKEVPLPLSLDESDESDAQQDPNHTNTTTCLTVVMDGEEHTLLVPHCTCVNTPKEALTSAYQNFYLDNMGRLCAQMSVTCTKTLRSTLLYAFKKQCTAVRVTNMKEKPKKPEEPHKKERQKRQKKQVDALSTSIERTATAFENFMQGLQLVPHRDMLLQQEKEAMELRKMQEKIRTVQWVLDGLHWQFRHRTPEEKESLINECKLQNSELESLKQNYTELQKKPKQLTIKLRLHDLLSSLKTLKSELEIHSGTNTTSETTGADLVNTINTQLSGLIDLDWGAEKESTLRLLVFLEQNVRLKILPKIDFESWLCSFCSSTPKNAPKVHQRASSTVPLSKVPGMLRVKFAYSKSPHALDDSKGQGVPCTQYECHLPSTAGPLFHLSGITIRTPHPKKMKEVLEQTFFSLPQVLIGVDERRTGLLKALRYLKYLLLQNYLKPFAFSRLVVRWLKTIDATDHPSFIEDMIDFITGLPSDVIPRELIQAMARYLSRGGMGQHNDVLLKLDSLLDAIGFYMKKFENPPLTSNDYSDDHEVFEQATGDNQPSKREKETKQSYTEAEVHGTERYGDVVNQPIQKKRKVQTECDDPDPKKSADTTTTQARSSNVLCGCGLPLDVCRRRVSGSTNCTK
jgi:hypothetical protein